MTEQPVNSKTPINDGSTPLDYSSVKLTVWKSQTTKARPYKTPGEIQPIVAYIKINGLTAIAVRGPSRFHSLTLQHRATHATTCNDPYHMQSQVASCRMVTSAIGGVDPIGIYIIFSVSLSGHGLCICSVRFVLIPCLFHCI
jgi:hypothetical protein